MIRAGRPRADSMGGRWLMDNPHTPWKDLLP